jgi:hypothetical protein
MKTLTALLLLVCIPLFGSGLDEGDIRGAWLQRGAKWTNAPPDINPHLQTAETEILYFGKDLDFAIIDCVVNRVPKEYETISHGDGRSVYLGKWNAAGDDLGVEYRLVDRTLKIKGEVLPGPMQHATLKASHGVLDFGGKIFHRAVGLDKSAAEVLNGLPSSQ